MRSVCFILNRRRATDIERARAPAAAGHCTRYVAASAAPTDTQCTPVVSVRFYISTMGDDPAESAILAGEPIPDAQPAWSREAARPASSGAGPAAQVRFEQFSTVSHGLKAVGPCSELLFV